MKTYKHIFFDLDHTLWDFEANSKKALQQIFEEQNLGEKGIPSFESFHAKYLPINDRYWARYHHGFVPKEKLRVGRFHDTLKEFNVDDEVLAEAIAASYLSISPKMTALFADAMEVLKYLQDKYPNKIRFKNSKIISSRRREKKDPTLQVQCLHV